MRASIYLVPALCTLVSSMSLTKRAYSGVATFNDYSAQSKYTLPLPILDTSTNNISTVCGPKSGVSGTYGVAIGDLSPDIWSGGQCYASIDYSKWCAVPA